MADSIFLNAPGHGDLIAQASGSHFNPRCDICVSRERDGELLGGAVYQNYTRTSIAMHVAGFCDDWLSKDLLWIGFHYPFVQLGVERIFGQVPESNVRALEFDLRLGFKELIRIDGVFPDGGLVVVVMERGECKWLRLRPSRLRPGREHPDGWQSRSPSAA